MASRVKTNQPQKRVGDQPIRPGFITTRKQENWWLIVGEKNLQDSTKKWDEHSNRWTSVGNLGITRCTGDPQPYRNVAECERISNNDCLVVPGSTWICCMTSKAKPLLPWRPKRDVALHLGGSRSAMGLAVKGRTAMG